MYLDCARRRFFLAKHTVLVRWDVFIWAKKRPIVEIVHKPFTNHKKWVFLQNFGIQSIFKFFKFTQFSQKRVCLDNFWIYSKSNLKLFNNSQYSQNKLEAYTSISSECIWVNSRPTRNQKLHFPPYPRFPSQAPWKREVPEIARGRTTHPTYKKLV